MSQSAVGTIFNVQRFSLHDGPGMRDLIFLKYKIRKLHSYT